MRSILFDAEDDRLSFTTVMTSRSSSDRGKSFRPAIGPFAAHFCPSAQSLYILAACHQSPAKGLTRTSNPGP
jgi:hypothetical protein